MTSITRKFAQEVPPDDREGERRKYLEDCLCKCRQIYPLVISVDDLLGVEAEYTLKHTSIRLMMKCKQPYSRTCCYVNSSMEIALVR